MQINRTGYSLLAFFFGSAGSLFTRARRSRSSRSRSSSARSGSLVSLGLAVYAIRQARSGRHEQWLWKTGVKGKGTLVSASSGVLINDQPLMKLELDLEVPGQPPRRVTRKLIISDFAAHLMEPGLVLPVYVNPQDPDDILVVW